VIDHALLEMTRLEAAKETDNKLRWDVDIDDTRFSLYIPKWRIPHPWPSRIWVAVVPRRGEGEDQSNLSPNDVGQEPTLTREPIIATIKKMAVHTKTIHYCPVGDPENQEIGEPYLPFAVTYGGADRLRIIVLWDITSRGLFQGRVGTDM
jgi:hypothetical protein